MTNAECRITNEKIVVTGYIVASLNRMSDQRFTISRFNDSHEPTSCRLKSGGIHDNKSAKTKSSQPVSTVTGCEFSRFAFALEEFFDDALASAHGIRAGNSFVTKVQLTSERKGKK